MTEHPGMIVTMTRNGTHAQYRRADKGSWCYQYKPIFCLYGYVNGKPQMWLADGRWWTLGPHPYDLIIGGAK